MTVQTSAGVGCSRCGSTESYVRCTRPIRGAIRRYRECLGCGKQIKTRELCEEDILALIEAGRSTNSTVQEKSASDQ